MSKTRISFSVDTRCDKFKTFFETNFPFILSFLYSMVLFFNWLLLKMTRRHFRQNCRQNASASTETFTENQLRRNFALHFTSYLSIALSKILPHWKTIKNTKKLSVFGENESRRLSIFLTNVYFLKLWNIFLESTIKSITGIGNNNSYHDGTSAFFQFFFPKKMRTLFIYFFSLYFMLTKYIRI